MPSFYNKINIFNTNFCFQIKNNMIATENFNCCYTECVKNG